jgi:hypothetical protein
VLDLVDPIGTGRGALGSGRQAGLDEAGWTGTHQHTGVIAAAGADCESGAANGAKEKPR